MFFFKKYWVISYYKPIKFAWVVRNIKELLLNKVIGKEINKETIVAIFSHKVSSEMSLFNVVIVMKVNINDI